MVHGILCVDRTFRSTRRRVEKRRDIHQPTSWEPLSTPRLSVPFAGEVPRTDLPSVIGRLVHEVGLGFGLEHPHIRPRTREDDTPGGGGFLKPPPRKMASCPNYGIYPLRCTEAPRH